MGAGDGLSPGRVSADGGRELAVLSTLLYIDLYKLDYIVLLEKMEQSG